LKWPKGGPSGRFFGRNKGHPGTLKVGGKKRKIGQAFKLKGH